MDMRKLTAVVLSALCVTGATFAQPGAGPAAPAQPVVNDPRLYNPATPPNLVYCDPGAQDTAKCWLDLDFLLYWISPSRYPQPFLTTSSPASLGVLGQADTSVLIGGDVNFQTHNGVRLYAGGWWDEARSIGLEGEIILLEQRARGFNAVSDGTTVLARPVINALNGSQASTLVAFPGAGSGSMVIEFREKFATGDANLICNLVREGPTWINGLAGFRYVYYHEDVRATQNQQFLGRGLGQLNGVPLPPGATMAIQDQFETVNNLYVFQLGLRGETMRGPISLTGHAKVGLGLANERTFVEGQTSVGGTTVPGGVLAQVTIPSRNYQDQFVVVPEVGGQVGYQITPRWRLHAGYNLLYISNLARPGLQIDPIVNPNIIPSSQQFTGSGGPAVPTWRRNTSDLLVHGVSLGATFRY